MNIYEKKSWWKMLLLIAALLIVAASLIYTNILAKKIAAEERKKVELWANAYKNLNQAGPDTDIGFLFEVIKNNETVPVILTDEEDNILAHRNLDTVKAAKPGYLQKKLNEMKEVQEPIEIEIFEGQKNYIYYENSYLLTQLRYYPFIQFGIIGIFLLVGYLAFSTSRKAEQNQVWVGMAKETAHQLGTPLSSLSAWVEHLREKTKADKATFNILNEVESDLQRLELITERFSKIGSAPKLEKHDVAAVLQNTINYIKTRSSDKVKYKLKVQPEGATVKAKMNPALFDWVIENLLKNALDAMEGVGKIEVVVRDTEKLVYIDVSDTGKGIPRRKQKTIFNPGYSTKRRGWGLGLSLSKRIIEKYHNGKIFVKYSAPDKGTTFEIILPK